MAIFSEQESQAVYFLRLQNVARIDVVNFISHGISKIAEQSEQEEVVSGDGSEVASEKNSKAF